MTGRMSIADPRVLGRARARRRFAGMRWMRRLRELGRDVLILALCYGALVTVWLVVDGPGRVRWTWIAALAILLVVVVQHAVSWRREGRR